MLVVVEPKPLPSDCKSDARSMSPPCHAVTGWVLLNQFVVVWQNLILMCQNICH